eukprot:9491382-Pyramimonas_sp.AAC.2
MQMTMAHLQPNGGHGGYANEEEEAQEEDEEEEDVVDGEGGGEAWAKTYAPRTDGRPAPEWLKPFYDEPEDSWGVVDITLILCVLDPSPRHPPPITRQSDGIRFPRHSAQGGGGGGGGGGGKAEAVDFEAVGARNGVIG